MTESPRSYQTGLVIGRFQPFHKGHLYLLQRSLEMCEQIVIAIGSAESHDEKNPLSFAQRQALLSAVVENEGWQSRVTKIIPAIDFPSDEDWLRELEKNVGSFDVAIGNNDWVNTLMQQAGYAIQEIPLLEREIYEGTKIRELIHENERWQDRAPKYLVQKIDGFFTQAGAQV